MNRKSKVKGIAFLLSTLLIIASLVLPPTPALAYVFARSYFIGQQFNIPYCNYGQSSYRYTVENSAAAWNSSAADVVYVEKLPPCDTSLVDVDNGYYGKLGWAATTDIKAESNDTPCNGWHEMLYAQIHLNQSYMDNYSNGQRQSTGAHELGHPFNLGDE